MVEIKKIVSTLNGKVLGGAKIPHSVSNPVLRVVDDVPYIAAFVYIYNRENIQQNKMPRPVHWIVADLASGDVVNEFDDLYDLNDPNVKRPTREDFVEIYSLFDSVRAEYLNNGRCDTETYRRYLDRILEITPASYQKFYQELSNL